MRTTRQRLRARCSASIRRVSPCPCRFREAADHDLRTDLSELWAYLARDHADGCVHLLLRLCRLRDAAAAQGGGLLRVLFVRVGSLSPGTSQSIVLRHAEQPMSGEVECATGRADWAHGIRGWLSGAYPLRFCS